LSKKGREGGKEGKKEGRKEGRKEERKEGRGPNSSPKPPLFLGTLLWNLIIWSLKTRSLFHPLPPPYLL
jgi:predicted transposase YdaD